MGKHEWTFQEDRLCCKRYVEEYVIQKADTRLSEFVEKLSRELVSIKPTSLRMKVQNIKAIMLELRIADSFRYKESSNYSKQNLEAMKSVLNEMNIG